MNFMSSLTCKESPTKIWNKIKTHKGILFTQLRTLIVDQTIYTNPGEITDQLGQYFYSNTNNSSLNPDFLKYKEN
jgi:hypothetical protein